MLIQKLAVIQLTNIAHILILLFDIFVTLQLLCHALAVVQYTFQHKQYTEENKTFLEECGPCPVFASFTLAFALQLRKKHGKTSVRVAEERQLVRRGYINTQ